MTPEDADRISRDEAALTLNPAAVAFYVNRFKVDEKEARRRLADQSVGASLSRQIESATDGSAGVIWYDNSVGSWRIPLTKEATKPAVEDIVRRLDVSEGSVIESAPVTEQQLADIEQEVSRELAGDDVSVSTGKNRIEVSVDDETSADDVGSIRGRVAEVAQAHQVPWTVSEVPLPESRPDPVINCSFPYCDQLVGGTQWLPVGCTMAFYVGPAGAYDPYMLSAGHCNSGQGASWSTCNHVGTCPTTLGYQTNIYLGGAPEGDGMLLRNLSATPSYPGYFNWSVNGLSTVRGYYAYDPGRSDIGNAPSGTVVCKNGARSGTTCGDIADNNAPPFIQQGTNARFTHMLRINACSGQGDSGAPWTGASQEIAIGVQSSGYVLADGSCDPSYTTSFAEPVGRALYMTGVSIYGN